MNALETRVIELLDRKRALNDSRADVIDEIGRINSRFVRTQSFDSLQKAIEYDNDRRVGKNQVKQLDALCDSYAKEMRAIEEEIMSILAARHKVPITAVLDIENWHEFHNQPNLPDRPYALDQLKYLVNIVAVYRLSFGDRTWPLFRERLSSFSWDGGEVRIGDDIFGIVESPAMLEYGRQLQSRFKTTDLDFLLEGWPHD